MLKLIAIIPVGWQITIIILAMFLITIITIYGRVMIGWGKQKIGIGLEHSQKWRSCMDCSKYHRSTAAKVNFKITRIESSIMKNKMNNVEQELLDLKRNMYTKFSHIIKDSENYIVENELKDFNTRIRLILNDVVKDEIRRSIKENGFHQKEGDAFVKYVDSQKKVIKDLIEDNLLLYYDNDIILKISDAIKDNLMKVIKSVYTESRIIELEASKIIKMYEEDYDKELDEQITKIS